MSWLRRNLLALVAICLALPAGAHAAGTVAKKTVAKNTVVSKSIRNGAVKARDLSSDAVSSPKVADNSLTGADIDESTLTLGPQTDLVVRRLSPGSPLSTVAAHNGLTIKVGCTGTGDTIILRSQEDGVGIYENGLITHSYQQPLTDVAIYELDNDYDSFAYRYRRAADGAGVWVDVGSFNWDSGAPPVPLNNDDCLFWIRMTYTQL